MSFVGFATLLIGRLEQFAGFISSLFFQTPALSEFFAILDAASVGLEVRPSLASRLAEAGVRFIQVTDNGWDHHSKIGTGLRKSATGIDKPLAGLLTDLKARGLLP